MKKLISIIVISFVLLRQGFADDTPSPEEENKTVTPYFLSGKQIASEIIAEMIYVKGGTFQFNQHPFPRVPVSLSDYYMTKYAITYEQYKSYQKLIGKPVNTEPGDILVEFNGMYPATVNFNKAQAFCQWVGNVVGMPLTLPTEEQWEYAARSRGKNVLYATDNGKIEPGKNFPWFSGTGNTIPTNHYPPNSLGFYEMNADGMEWTNTCYDDYPTQAITDPVSDISQCDNVDMRGTSISDISSALHWKEVNESEETAKEDLSVYSQTYMPKTGVNYNFRCVINSKKPIDLKAVARKLSD